MRLSDGFHLLDDALAARKNIRLQLQQRCHPVLSAAQQAELASIAICDHCRNDRVQRMDTLQNGLEGAPSALTRMRLKLNSEFHRLAPSRSESGFPSAPLVSRNSASPQTHAHVLRACSGYARPHGV